MFEKVSQSLKYDSIFFGDHKHYINIVSFISNTSREYKYFYFRHFNNYTIVFISEIVIQNSDTLRLSRWHRSKQIKNTSCNISVLVPKSLRVKPLVNNEKGKEIAARSSKSFLKARISQNIRTITSLENDMMNH